MMERVDTLAELSDAVSDALRGQRWLERLGLDAHARFCSGDIRWIRIVVGRERCGGLLGKNGCGRFATSDGRGGCDGAAVDILHDNEPEIAVSSEFEHADEVWVFEFKEAAKLLLDRKSTRLNSSHVAISY